MIILRFMVAALLLASASLLCTAAPSSTRPFVSGSVSEILASWENKPIMLVLWSIECPPCVHELGMFAELRKKHPELNLVMVSTDGVSFIAEIEKILVSHGLENIESWVFAEGNAQRLRYEIDPTWYGELPRTYFFDKDHKPSAISGALTKRQVETWIHANFELTDNTTVFRRQLFLDR